MLASVALLGAVLLSPPSDSSKSVNAVRVPSGQAAPVIDGRLDEAVWRAASPAGGFVQYTPNPGAPATQRTEAWVAYDDQAVYVGVRLYDTHPDSVVGQLARRDQNPYSDRVIVAFDSYHDRRTAYAFGVNPRGVKTDAFIYNDGDDDDGWNAVWDAAARVDSLGWTAEFRIPLSQLRYSARDMAAGKVWGFNVKREVARTREESFWAPFLPNVSGLVSRFGELRGLEGLPSPRRMEVQPYSLARVTRAPLDRGNPFYRRNDPAAGVGADLKYGIASNFTLTATLNPDFGQVEADPSQVNLSAYETFLPEQRPFFVEGADIFRFGIGAGDGDFGSEALFYSRRIGRAPQGGSRIPDDALFEVTPQSSNILGAAKLTGKTPGGWSVGVLDAVTGREEARYTLPGELDERTTAVEPLTNYAVARVIRDFRQGKSAVGGVLAMTHRDLRDEDGLGFLRSAAYAGGIDGRHRFGGGNYELHSWVLGSSVVGDSAAIRRTQRASTRYFQRPDADYLTYDPTRTSLSGWATGTELLRIGGGNWRWGGVANVRSPGFEVNDLGYQRDADQALGAWFLQYRKSKAGKTFRSWNLNLNGWAASTFGGEVTQDGGNVNGSFQLRNFWRGNGGIGHEFSVTSVRALRGGPAIRVPGNTNAWAGFHSDSRRKVSGGVSAGGSWEEETDGYSWSLAPSLTWRASARSELSLEPSYSRQLDARQYVDVNSKDDGAPHYVFGDLDQTTAALTARLSYTFTPNLSLQLYAQPFVSAGRASRFREVALTQDGSRVVATDRFAGRFRPLAVAAVDGVYAPDTDGDGVPNLRFDDPDFNVKEFRSNAVLRWEYRPGSTLFVVWSQGREDSMHDGSFGLRRDVRRLFGFDDRFGVPSTNVLLVKVNYWLNL
ncbi:MAG: carbohydrate binding family 9 domain-containing protein [Gemmatimonadetes bacterium]|nr:carbohydrate binding family 9 domain-containing protein [Gemmatimonadota bacterium]